MKPKPSSPRVLALTAIVAGALLIRLAVCTHEGLFADLDLNERWANSAVTLGFAESYATQLDDGILPNHPPVSVAAFAVMGLVYRTFFSPSMELYTTTYRVLIKLPAILADAVLVAVLGICFTRWGDRRKGLLAATAYAFNPGVLFDSAIWGQTDALPALFTILAIVALASRNAVGMGIWLALAVMSKAQTIAILPALALPALRSPSAATRSALATCGMGFIIAIPFVAAGTFDALLRVFTHSIGQFPILSSSAYNLWWALFLDSAFELPSTDMFVGFLSYRLVGIALYACFALWGIIATRDLWRSSKERDRWEGLLLAAAVGAYAFFLFNTEMHERYLFPFMSLGLPLLFRGGRMATVYCCSSVLFTLNMMSYLRFGVIDRALFDTFPAFDGIIAWGHLTCFALLMHWLVRDRARRNTTTRAAL